MLYSINYLAKTGIVMKYEFSNFTEYYNKLEYLRGKGTNILDYGAIGEYL